MVKDVSVVIALSKASPRVGFGKPLIFELSEERDVAYTEVSSLTEVIAAGFDATTEVYKTAQLIFMQNNAPGTIAVAATQMSMPDAFGVVSGEDWRQLIVVGGNGYNKDISDAIESYEYPAVYFTHAKKASVPTTANSRTVVVAYDSTDVSCPEAAVVGATAGLDVGSFTYKNIILKGVTPQGYTAAEVEALNEKGVMTILKKAGSIVTSEGKACDGEYIDILDSKDYIISQIEYKAQDLMNRVPKLPYDNRGIASLESVVLSVLMDAAGKGMIAQDENGYMYSVNFGGRSTCADSDISARNYVNGSFSFTLAGAIHTATITGEIVA